MAVVARRFGGGAVVDDPGAPSVSKKSDGSIPSNGSQIGSDHGPAGFLAVMTKLPPQETQVLTM